MQKENVHVEIETRFLTPGMILSGDAYDENNNLILKANTEITKELVSKMSNMGIDLLYYTQERLKPKKDISKPMIQDEHMEEAMGLIESLEKRIRGGITGVPEKEVNHVVNTFITDIRGNEDAYLNLLDLFHYDDYTYTHSINVSTISILIGVSMRFDDKKLNILGVAGLLHDIGKTLVPTAVLDKPAKLNDDEWEIMKKHPVYGYNIVSQSENLDPEIPEAILNHHENYMGGGYPKGITHEEMSIYPQILSVADVFDALTTRRPYKEPFQLGQAFSFIMENSGKKFNPSIAQTFLRNLIKKINEEPLYPENSYVLLNTGEIGYIVGYRDNNIFTLKPIVNLFLDAHRTGKSLADRLLKRKIQIDLEKDTDRWILKRILDKNYTTKFDLLLGKAS